MLCDVYSRTEYIHKNGGGISEMKEYIFILIGVSIICGIVQTLAPDSSGDGIKKHVKLVSSLCILCLILAPISTIISGLSENGLKLGEWWGEGEVSEERYAEVYKESMEQYTAEELGEKCKNMVADRFEIDRDIFDVNVFVVCENERLTVDRAVLSLHKTTDQNDPRLILEYISSLLECECEIIYT